MRNLMWTLVALVLAGTAHAKKPVRLYTNTAHASSYLVSNWNKFTENYHPYYAFDDNPATAWVEGSEGDGIGSQLYWYVSAVDDVHQVELKFRNGYQKSSRLFKANARAKKIQVSLWYHGSEFHKKTYTLKDMEGWQTIAIDFPETRSLSRVELTIESSYPGTKYKDLCISDVQLWVTSDTKYNAKVELGKHKALMTWINERVDRAKFFAKRPADYPFLSASYTVEDGENYSVDKRKTSLVDRILKNEKPKMKGLSDEVVTQIQRLAATMSKLQKSPKWFAVATNRQTPLPETPAVGSMQATYDQLLNMSQLDDVSFFEATDETGKSFKRYGGHHHGHYSNAKIAKIKQDTYVYFYRHDVWQERGVYQSKHHFLLHYRGNQLIEWLVHSPEHNYGEPIEYSHLKLGKVDYKEDKLWRMQVTDVFTSRNTEGEGLELPPAFSRKMDKEGRFEYGARLSTFRPDRDHG